jgi:2-polyprenyl-3-methyl-5-hydroxy-6-metoxy-1,4-benzoquinol methylase
MPATAQGFPTVETLTQDKGEDLQVFQCEGCGMVQLTNTPVSYYRDVIRAAAFSDDMHTFRLAQFNDWVNAYQLNGKKILEIGCGKGEYLSLLNATGVEAFGIEHAKDSVEVCRQEGLNVYQGYLGDNNMAMEAAPFDGFMCLNFMEHWPDPVVSLRAISSQLNDGAIGLMEVPNFDMIVQKGLFSEFIADHLLYFTQDTLQLILQNNGFDVLKCKPVWQDYILSVVVRKRKPINLDFFNDFRQKISAELHAFLDIFSSGKVAVWGAGHQSLAVISLAEIEKKVAYVVDSASFKQGKFTTASHLPIVSPAQLFSQPVEAIVVMAASYSDEVARTIRTQYPNVKNIAILRDHGLEISGLEKL